MSVWMFTAHAAIAAVPLLAIDHLTGTAFYQKGNAMHADHFDIFSDDRDDEDGSTSDYWEAYLAAVESRGFSIHDDEGFTVLSDSELAELDDSADLFEFDSEDERADFLAAVFETDSIQAEEWDERYYEGIVDDADVDVWRSL